MRVLILDDSADDRETINRTLKRLEVFENLSVAEAASEAEGFAEIDRAMPDCLLLDNALPGRNGLEMLNEIHLWHPSLPVVMITGSGDERVAVEALKRGADDYIPKADLNSDALVAAIEQAVAKKRGEAEIIRRAQYDPVTGLPNRAPFLDRLGDALARGQRADRPLGVASIVLTGVREIYQAQGEEAGDRALRGAAKYMAAVMRRGDMLARVGHTEFMAYVEGLPSNAPRGMNLVVGRWRAALDSDDLRQDLGAATLDLTVGIALYPTMGTTPEMLIALAKGERHRRQQEAR